MSVKDLTAHSICKHKPYIPGRQPVISGRTIKLNTNENPYSPTPKIAELIAAQVNELHRYPNSSASDLREVIANLHNVHPDQIIVGNGSDDILNLCVRCFSDSSKSIGMLDPSYSLYEVLGSLQGTKVKKYPFQNERFEIDPEIIANSGSNLFFLTSPHAPTGRIYDNLIFSTILQNYSGILVIDEAYADFATTNALPLLSESENVIITRTLSKSYSLAGLRVGYAVASKEIIAILNKAREVYNVDRIAQFIAQVALQDRTYFEKITQKIISTREFVYQTFLEWQWTTYSSGANFLFTRPVDSKGSHGKEIAHELYRFLSDHNVFVRYFPSNELTSSFLRISIGKEEEMDIVVKLLCKWKIDEQRN